jgi:hypothetical protein
MNIDLGNYTGPYWSDGKIQPSVEFGESEPQSELDALSRLHDTAYAHYKDRAHREAADAIYAREAKKLVGKFPELAGNVVQYGNYTGRQATKLASDVGQFSFIPGLGPVYGLAKFAIGNILDSQKRIDGTHLAKELKHIEQLYARDPMLRDKQKKGNDVSATSSTSTKIFDAVKKAFAPQKVVPSKTEPSELIRRQAERVQHFQKLKEAAIASEADPGAYRGYAKPLKGALVKKWNGKKKKRKRLATISVCPQ